ncbi:MAG: hypothetical protein ACKVWV_04945 [Planctomycetota bacterium]
MKHFNPLGSTVLVALFASPGVAQCPDWVGGHHAAGFDRPVDVLRTIDDGGGDRLYAGGLFMNAFGVSSRHVGNWNGSTWTPMPGFASTNGHVARDFALYDDGLGAGPRIFASMTHLGDANNVSGMRRWSGSDWQQPGARGNANPGHPTNADGMAVLDSGVAPVLYVAADQNFGHLRLRWWNGVNWAWDFTTGAIRALFVFDDGTGPALYVGGSFANIGGVPFNGIAKFDGTNFHALGSGIQFDRSSSGEGVFTIGAFDDGSGAKLYVGGNFEAAGGVPAQNIARWDGATWSPLGSGISGSAAHPGDVTARVAALAVYRHASVSSLYAAGTFTTAGGVTVNHVAKWDGSSWSALGSGMGGVAGVAFSDTYQTVPHVVNTLAVFDDGSGKKLYAAGNFTAAGGRGAHYAAQWNGVEWSPLESATGVSRTIRALTSGTRPDGVAAAVYAGGEFQVAGEALSNRVAEWNGTEWSALGSGVNGTVLALKLFADPSVNARCPDLYAAGSFTEAGGAAAVRIARWDGETWSPLGGGVSGNVFGTPPVVRALEVFDGGNGPELYAAGAFTTVDGSTMASIARWDGDSWTNAGSLGVSAGLFDPLGVYALAVCDDGSGPALYIGGEIALAGDPSGQTPISEIVRYDGVHYSALGAGLPSTVFAILGFDDGSGPAVYAGGRFGIQRWDGTSWTNIYAGAVVRTLHVFDDGSGPTLFAGVETLGSSGSTRGLVRYDGSSFTTPGGGVTVTDLTLDTVAGSVYALASTTDPATGQSSLWLGGTFQRSGSVGATNFAQWRGCGSATGTAYCFGDGSLPTPCPCAPPDVVPNPSGTAGAGCANSFHLDGAKLVAVGARNPDAVVLQASRLSPAGFAFCIVGTGADVNGVAVGDGVRCAGGALTRFGSQFAVCGKLVYPNAAAGLTLPLSVVSGVTPGGGATRHYQVYYRNAATAFCGPGTANLSNSYAITWN